MTNAELIKDLRQCADEGNCMVTCDGCGHFGFKGGCMIKLLCDAADALEADERLLDQNTKRCEALRKQLRESHESYEKHINELKAQMPKEGEWIMDCLAPQMDPYRIGQWAYAPKCSECGTHLDAETNYCSNCGARMTKGDK